MKEKGKLLIVGIGPGNADHVTFRAKEAIQESDMIVGYKTYVELIEGLITEQEIISMGMTGEVARAQEAIKQAESGRVVAVISSGDAGVYGMAGLVYDVLMSKGWKEETGIGVEIIPGVSAIHSCASLLGAPIMHDACTISLSDHLTPWDLIAKRLEAAGQADFVIALYNPKSSRRTRQIVEAQKILLKYRSPETPVGLVKNAYRDEQQVIVSTLQEFLQHDIGMLSTVVIGNSATKTYERKMITPRGYERKYTLDSTVQPLKPSERLRKESEPWALDQSLDVSSNPKPKVKAEENINTLHGKNDVYIQPMESLFELAVRPGVADKKFTAEQLKTLADVVGENGTVSYSPDHEMVIRIRIDDPTMVTNQLHAVGLQLAPVGEVLSVKACDFCDGRRDGAIPYAEEIDEKLGGTSLPKKLNIGINGCGKVCYQAVMDDIGLVYRKGKFDLYLGAKTVGRTVHAGQPVAEGIEPENIVEMVTRIVQEYRENAYENERLFKYFKRAKELGGFQYIDMMPKTKLELASLKSF